MSKTVIVRNYKNGMEEEMPEETWNKVRKTPGFGGFGVIKTLDKKEFVPKEAQKTANQPKENDNDQAPKEKPKTV